MARREAIATLLGEIGEQATVVGRLLERQREVTSALAAAIRQNPPRAIVFVARGSSDNAAIYGRYLLETRNRLLTSLAAPSTVTLYGRGPDLSGTVVIGVSQSGRGEDVVTYLAAAAAQGATTVAVVNDASSPLASAAEWVLECQAGPEVSVPATKTVTAQMTILAMLSHAIEGDPPTALESLPGAISRALAARPGARRLARALVSTEAAAVVGRGFVFAAALEVALKLKETAYLRAEPFSAADFFHGPLALAEPGYAVLSIDGGGHSSGPAEAVGAAVRERGGRPLLLRVGPGRSDEERLALGADVDEALAPIVAVVAGQLIALELALARGLDPARPRGLKKVTSTR